MSFGTNAPEGFVENVSKISATCNSQDFLHDIASGYAVSLFTGDPVTSVAGFTTRALVGGEVKGVFKGVTFLNTNNELQFSPYWVASTVTKDAQPAKAYVIDDPFVVFTIQVGGTIHAATRAHIDKNANFNFGAGGSTFSGKSGAFLDLDTVGTGATLSCKIVDVTPGITYVVGVPTIPAENVLGQDYNNVNITFNNHKYKGGTGTVGT